MQEIRAIKGLIKRVNTLPFEDVNALKNFKKRAEMVTSKIFGDNHKYLYDLIRISIAGPDGVMLAPIDHRLIWHDGQSKMENLFNEMLKELEVSGVPDPTNQSKPSIKNSNRVFIVHGHDEAMKQAVDLTIRKLGLAPIILHEQADRGRTIIEKFIEYSDVGFAVVLLSPDDLSYSQEKRKKVAKPRARQNVIFELGFFIGKLGRERVFTLYKQKKDFELPSDYSGVLYTSYDNARRWEHKLVQGLKAVGMKVSADDLLSRL